MKEAGESGEDHFPPETESHAHMLEIGFSDAGRMFGKGSLDHGAFSSRFKAEITREPVKKYPTKVNRKTNDCDFFLILPLLLEWTQRIKPY